MDGDLTIDHLASIACLSRFHFARAFKAAIGQFPHQYVSAKRLERAKALVIRGDQTLVDIALALNFSCQANFTRAFRPRDRSDTGSISAEFQVRVTKGDTGLGCCLLLEFDLNLQANPVAT